MARSRVHDVVIYGATGFTGGLVAEYFARNVSLDRTPWAIAGRNRDKLLEVQRRLARIHPACAQLPIVIASTEDRASLAAMAKNARAVVSTVGPFVRYGEPLFAACADHGTDYVDSTGEPEFVRSMRARHGERARERGAIMVSCCGVDSIPTDLGAYFTMRELAPDAAVELEGLFEFHGRPSGGTWSSVLEALRDGRRTLSGRNAPVASAGREVGYLPARPHRDSELGWVVPFPTVDPEIALDSAAALPLYGPDFRYAHYLVLHTLARVVGLAAGAGALYGAAQLAPTRALLARLITPGQGPTEEERAKAWFKLRFRARHRGEMLVTEVSGGDPGYTETAKMLSECALSLVQDRARLPAQAGVLSPARAFGDVLLARLQRAGLVFRVVSR